MRAPTEAYYREFPQTVEAAPAAAHPHFDTLAAAVGPAVAHSTHPLDRALARLNASFDHLAEVAGLKFAA
jgi:hypothetical protein